MKQLVSVVVPLLNNTQQEHIKQSLETLSAYDIIWLTGENNTLPIWASSYEKAITYRFEDKYFESEEHFTRLLLSRKLYERFDWCEFVFLLQTSARINKDELHYWCKQGYDLIQPIAEQTSTNLLASFFSSANIGISEVPITTFTSLRRVDRFAKVTCNLHAKALTYCTQESTPPKSDWLFWESNTHPWKSALRIPTPVNRKRFGVVGSTTVHNDTIFVEVP